MQNHVQLLIRRLILWALRPTIYMYVLPGGKAPERKTDGALGYDAYVRAIVSPFEMDPTDPQLRRTVFDFRRLPEDAKVLAQIERRPKPDGTGDEMVWRLDPGKSVLVGLGFFTAMPHQFGYWMAPRSGLASRSNITLGNAPGTVDPDYRGEAGAVVFNDGDKPFYIPHEMRIAQDLFQWFIFPNIVMVRSPADLPASKRGTGGFGSTGLR